MEEATFNFTKNSVESVTLDTLKGTRNETNFGFKPLNGIVHFKFIDAIFNKLEQFELKGNLTDLYVGRGGSKTMPGVSFVGDEEDDEQKKDINNWIFRRVLGKIVLDKLGREDMKMAIAFNYHQMGLELAIGPNVDICQNFSILGQQSYISTHGVEKIPNPERMLEVFGDWMADYDTHAVEQFQLIDAMKGIQVGRNDVEQMIGDLTLQRIRHDSKKIKEDRKYAMNQSQIGRFAEEYAVKSEKKTGDPIDVYDLYNIGTEMYKAGDTDFPNVLSANFRFGTYLKSFFNLN